MVVADLGKISGQERCTRLSAQIADKNVKFLLSQVMMLKESQDQFTAKIVTRSIRNQKGFK